MLLVTITFDSRILFWRNDRRSNVCFLRCVEAHLNEILNHRGYVYLNEICEQVGVGWNPDAENLCIRNDRDDRRIDFVICDKSNNSLIVHIMTP